MDLLILHIFTIFKEPNDVGMIQCTKDLFFPSKNPKSWDGFNGFLGLFKVYEVLERVKPGF